MNINLWNLQQDIRILQETTTTPYMATLSNDQGLDTLFFFFGAFDCAFIASIVFF
jgi:hypothetical protein